MAKSSGKRKNEGKLFEHDIKSSIPEGFYVERYKDDTAGFKGVTNPADFRLYKYPYTFLLELKSYKGKSIPLSKIRPNQIKGLHNAGKHYGIFAGFLFNYRELEETYYVPVSDVVDTYYDIVEEEYIIKQKGRKSIPVAWCRDYGERIKQEKKRVRYTYNLEEFFNEYWNG